MRELIKATTFSDKVEVINRCTEIVAENADIGVEHAVMAASLMPAGLGRQAAMVAAMKPVYGQASETPPTKGGGQVNLTLS